MWHEWRRNAYRVSVRKVLKIKMPFTRTRRRWEDNIRIRLQEVESGEEWIIPAQDIDKCLGSSEYGTKFQVA